MWYKSVVRRWQQASKQNIDDYNVMNHFDDTSGISAISCVFVVRHCIFFSFLLRCARAPSKLHSRIVAWCVVAWMLKINVDCGYVFVIDKNTRHKNASEQRRRWGRRSERGGKNGSRFLNVRFERKRPNDDVDDEDQQQSFRVGSSGSNVQKM